MEVKRDMFYVGTDIGKRRCASCVTDEEEECEMTRLVGLSWSREESKSLATKIRNGIGHWHTFLEIPGCEATNNRAERALREHVVQRKIMECFRNHKGTRT